MASNQGKQEAVNGDTKAVAIKEKPESVAIARRGIRTANDFACLMGALMADMLESTVSAEVGNATCMAGANLLKVIEMQHKFGSSQPNPESKVLVLTQESGHPRRDVQ